MLASLQGLPAFMPTLFSFLHVGKHLPISFFCENSMRQCLYSWCSVMYLRLHVWVMFVFTAFFYVLPTMCPLSITHYVSYVYRPLCVLYVLPTMCPLCIAHYVSFMYRPLCVLCLSPTMCPLCIFFFSSLESIHYG